MSKNSIFGLISQFLGQQNNISVPVPLVRILGDYTAAAFTSQVTYWSDRTTDPEGWFWKTHDQWQEELHLTGDQIRRCVRTADGLIEVKRAGVPAKNYYRINRELLIERLQGLADSPIVITSRNGETQHLEMDKPNSKPQGVPTASRTADPISSTKTSSKTTSETSPKEGGEYNVVGDARAQEPTAPVVEPTPAPVTTTIATRENRSGQTPPIWDGQTESTSTVAVVSPDGEAADAASTDTERELLFGNQAVAKQEAGTITEVQEVPGGPAAPHGAQEAQEGPSGSDLVPRGPEETRAVLAPALGGLKKLADLMGETPPGLKAGARQDWITRITPERAEQIIAVARLEAGAANPWTYIIRHLDQEIGAQIKRSGSRQGDALPMVTPNGASLQAASRPEVVENALPNHVCSVGTRWRTNDSGEIVTITRISLIPIRNNKTITMYHLSDGQELKSFELMIRYEYIQ